MDDKRQGLYERTCPVCGKVFIPMNAGIWAYRSSSEPGATLYCSWHCLRTVQKSKAREKETQIPETPEQIWLMLRKGYSNSEIAGKLGITVDKVRYWREKFFEDP